MLATQANAYPLADRPANVGNIDIQVFPDNLVGGLYWYVPTSVEPLMKNGVPQSWLDATEDELVFMFRGIPSVDENTLNDLAKNLGIQRSNLKPIFYNSNKISACASDLYDPTEVKWMIPKQMGNFMEILSIGARTKDKLLIQSLNRHFSGTGLSCVYEYDFSAAYTAYKVHVEIDLNRIYSRIQNEAHAEGMWWEVDLKSFMERMQREGHLTIVQYQDSTSPDTKLDDQIRASFDDVLTKVIGMIFTPAIKIHDEDMVGRGRPWSLRQDYRSQAEYNHFTFDLESQAVQKKASTISVRLGLK
jgi:hypothetical protein